MKRLIILGLSILGTSAVSAQPHPGALLIGGGYPHVSQDWIYGLVAVDKSTGSFTTLIDTGRLSINHIEDLAMDVDNRTYVFCTYGSDNSLRCHSGVFKYDRATNTVTTIAASMQEASRFQYCLKPTQDGDWIHACAGTGPTPLFNAILRHTGPSAWTTVATADSITAGLKFYWDGFLDYDTGDILIHSDGRTLAGHRNPIFSVTAHGTLGTWNGSAHGGNTLWGGGMRIADGHVYSSWGSDVYQMQKGSQPRTTIAHLAIQFGHTRAFLFENQSAARPEALILTTAAVSTLYLSQLVHVDPANWTITKTTDVVRATSKVPLPGGKDMYHDRDRYIATVRTAPRRWDLRLSAPAFPGRSYVLGAGASGIRPGVTIPDGRHIWLNPDPLTVATVGGLLGTFLNPGGGTLDARGSAAGWLDLRALGPSRLGGVIHLMLLVLDPGAPSGIAFITEPYPFQI